jgi:phosphoribosylaminoimidazolecarboxamide formyltransferase/IMP cyclohydrolase
MDFPKIEHALLSVSDKTDLVHFAQHLGKAGITLYASGGTRRHLEAAGLSVVDVAAYTGFPEMMDGRIKTLHPKIHGGILARPTNPEDQAALADHGIVCFGLVIVNLYPFQQTICRLGVTFDEAVEQIDIGGPTMVRAAAKNHAFVTVACDPTHYAPILEQIQKTGATTSALRRELAAAAFAHTAQYDTAIAAYFGEQAARAAAPDMDLFPRQLAFSAWMKSTLRYGENPHQGAALYQLPAAGPHSLVCAEQLHGKELSYNNLLDLDAALAVARALPQPSVAVLKHNNPCGAATAATLGEATQKAWDGDPLSAFGSILGFNVPVDTAAAECLTEEGKFVEAIVAPEFEPDALHILTTRPKWKSNVRLLKVGMIEPGRASLQLRAVDGGYLVQQADDLPDDTSAWKVVTATGPTVSQWDDLDFAWTVCRFVKSNAIVLVRDAQVVGVGAGQMSRVDSVEIAIRKAAERSRGAVLASDAFFPFDDSIRAAAAAGIVAVIQPGGSRRDDEVIAACDQHRLPMIFTGTRHFRH